MLFLSLIHIFLGDALAGCKDGDARGIAHDELAAHHALGFAQGQAFFGGVKCFLRAGGNFGVNVFLAQQARAVGMVATFDFGQGCLLYTSGKSAVGTYREYSGKSD